MDAKGPVDASNWLMEPRQQEIHRRLGLLGPGPASAYIDACYDNEVRGLAAGLPELWQLEDEFALADCGPDGARLVRQEGWMCLQNMPMDTGTTMAPGVP